MRPRTSDSHLFHTRDDLVSDGWELNGNVFERGKKRMLPLYEAKMIHHYDDRWATYERDGSVRDVTVDEKRDPNFVVMPRYWVDQNEVVAKRGNWGRDWLLGWRRIARSTDERTLICAVVSEVAMGDSIFLMLPSAVSDPADGSAGGRRAQAD